jgi:D-alanyl-D-alanine carboxypeptidase (penicillin-binding protein 5/6)
MEQSLSSIPAAASRWIVALALICAATTLPGQAGGQQSATKKDEGFQTAAPTAILIDAVSGTVLFEKNADQPVAPASLAKLMTAEIVFSALKEGELKLEDEFVVSENAWRKGGGPSGGSSMFAILHSRVKVQDLIRGVIIQSGNDACIVLAEGIAGNEANFSRLMTARAHELGLTSANFTNSTGLPDPDMRVSVRDLARLAQHIIKTYPEFYEIYGEREFIWNKIRQQNRNPLLAMNIGADGMKTGFTTEAGYGLVGSAAQKGLRLIVVVNGLKTAKDRADEARKLLEWGFNGFESRLLFAEGAPVGSARLFGGAQGSVELTGADKQAIRLLIPRNSNDKIIARIVYRGPVHAPVDKGQRIGALKVWRNDQLVLEFPLETAESVGTGSLPGRAFDAATEMFYGWIRSGVERL